MPTRPMPYDDARELLREAESDLAAVRGWPATGCYRLEWERSCDLRRESLRELVKRLAAGQAAGKRDAVLAGEVWDRR